MRGFTLPTKFCVLVLSVLCSTVSAAEPPYKESELGDALTITSSQRRTALSDIGRFIRAKRQPAGELFECYQMGSTTLDHWLSFPVKETTTPPEGVPSYYRFVYRDGYPVANYWHDSSGVRPARSYYYDQRSFPVVSVMNDKDGKTLLSSLLVYDNTDRIKRVMVFDAKDALVRVVCFRHPGDPGVLETWTYGMPMAGKDGLPGKGRLENHSLDTSEASYRIENGEKIRLNNKLRAAYMADLAKHGIRPFYPVP